MDLFFKGMVLGFSIAAPIGPNGVLCIRKTLEFGRLSGLCSGLGAATVHMIYALISAFGLTLVSGYLMEGQIGLRLVGGGFLLYLGARIFRARPNVSGKNTLLHKTLLADYSSSFLFAITNPLTIFSFLALFSGVGLSADPRDAGWLVLGVFLGSALWWLMLTEGTNLCRRRVDQRTMSWVNRIGGCIIAGFGVAIIGSLWKIFRI